MKKLTKIEMKNVRGGGDPLPPGCFCFNYASAPGEPGGGVDPDCIAGSNQQFCPNYDVMVCC